MAQTASSTLLSAVSATGDGPVIKTMFPVLAVGVQAEIAGSPAACVINVMALLDGVTWDTIAVLDVTQGYVSGEITMLAIPTLVRQIKGNIGSLSAGATVSLYVTWRH
jgi:hypothetical protein